MFSGDKTEIDGLQEDSLRSTSLISLKGEANLKKLTKDERGLLGVSVAHLNNRLPECDMAISRLIEQVIETGHAWGTGNSKVKISAASEGTVYMATYAYHNPMSEHVVCPIDGEMGTSYSYVNTRALSEKDDVGYASAFLSYSWSCRWHDVVPALTECHG